MNRRRWMVIAIGACVASFAFTTSYNSVLMGFIGAVYGIALMKAFEK